MGVRRQDMPEQVVATGSAKPAAGEGGAEAGGAVDWSVGAALVWPGGLTATILCSLGGSTPEAARRVDTAARPAGGGTLGAEPGGEG